MRNEEDLLDENDDESCFLNEEQVPGASLGGRDVATLKVPELKRWLLCRRASTKGLKSDLIARIKVYIENGWASKVVNPDLPMGSSSSKDLTEVDSTVSPPTEGWQSIQSAFNTPSEVPKFSLSNIIYYFVTRTTVDGKAASDFKSINKSAENLFQCGHVQALAVTDKNEYWWVKGDCRPEMKKDKMYKMIMCICKGSWDINSALCGCPAGRGPHASCKHIGALCYALANFCSCGQLPDFITCTDTLQAWNKPYPKKHDPITVDQLKSKRMEILDQPSSRQPIPELYDPRPASLQAVNHKHMEDLRLSLLTIDHSCGILQQLIPSDVYLKHDHTYCCSDSDKVTLSSTKCESDQNSCERETVTAEDKEAILLELAVTPTERLQIEALTRGQTESPLWHEVRAKRITGSKCGKILCQISKTNALLKSVLYPSPMINKPPAIKWGIDNEKLARNLYVEYMRENGHDNLVVEDCGFIVGLHEGWLGASPDDRVYDPSSNKSNGIVEIKCPYTKRTLTPQEACDDPSFYCKIVNGQLELKCTHAYYHQVQQQLYVSSDLFSWCDFCIFTTKGCLVTRIIQDESWVKQYIPQLKSYFDDYMLDEITNPQLKPPYYL